MGMTAAHSIWSLSDSGSVFPIIQHDTSTGKIQLLRIVCNDSDEAKKYIDDKIKSLNGIANNLAFAVDAYYRIDGVRYDALVVGAISLEMVDSIFQMAIPFRWNSVNDFKIYKPKIVEWKNCESIDRNQAIQGFWNGVDSHENGSTIWNKCLDQSL